MSDHNQSNLVDEHLGEFSALPLLSKFQIPTIIETAIILSPADYEITCVM